MATARAVDPEETFPQISTPEIRIKLSLNKGGQGAAVRFAGSPHPGPVPRNTLMEEGLVELARLVDPGAYHPAIFRFFYATSNPRTFRATRSRLAAPDPLPHLRTGGGPHELRHDAGGGIMPLPPQRGSAHPTQDG